MKTEHDFAGALEHLKTTQDGTAYLLQHEKTIQAALCLADRLQRGDFSDAVIEVMASKYDPTWGYLDASIGKDWARESLKVGAQQLLDEMSDGACN